MKKAAVPVKRGKAAAPAKRGKAAAPAKRGKKAVETPEKAPKGQEIAAKQSRTPLLGRLQLVALTVHTREDAEEARLKILEEHPFGAHVSVDTFWQIADVLKVVFNALTRRGLDGGIVKEDARRIEKMADVARGGDVSMHCRIYDTGKFVEVALCSRPGRYDDDTVAIIAQNVAAHLREVNAGFGNLSGENVLAIVKLARARRWGATRIAAALAKHAGMARSPAAFEMARRRVAKRWK